MRLIDADKLMEYCQNLKERKIDCNDIARFSTAYDVGKVVKELKKKIDHNREWEDDGYFYGLICAYQNAIEIVKDGGKNCQTKGL